MTPTISSITGEPQYPGINKINGREMNIGLQINYNMNYPIHQQAFKELVILLNGINIQHQYHKP